MKLPHHLVAGKQARLFSSLKLSNKEQIATSTILAVFRLVPELLSELIGNNTVRISEKTILDTFTEVNLKKVTGNKTDRPDGFIYIKNRNEWTSLIEAKVGNARLDADQIHRYLEDAKNNKVNAIITISNEFTPKIDQSPISVSRRLLNNVSLLHLSWRLILSTALRLKHQAVVEDREKSFVLDELIKFLRDDSVGNKSFSMMPKAWSDVCNETSIGSKLKTNDERVLNVANALIEEFSEIALNLTDHLGVRCAAKTPNSALRDNSQWQKQIGKSICGSKPIICGFDIPNAANTLSIEIDLGKSSFSVGMEVKAPLERKTVSGRANWMARMLKGKDIPNSFVKVRWNSRAADDFIEMSNFSGDYFKGKSFAANISSFTPMIRVQSSKTFKSRKNFIIELEKTVIDFYDTQAQHLKKWTPKAPPPIEEVLDVD